MPPQGVLQEATMPPYVTVPEAIKLFLRVEKNSNSAKVGQQTNAGNQKTEKEKEKGKDKQKHQKCREEEEMEADIRSMRRT